MPPKDLGEYVDWVMNQKPGLDQVDDGTRNQIKQNFVKGLEDQINAAVVAAMSDEQLSEFDKLLDGGDMSAIQEYCNKTVPQTPDLIAEILLDFKVNYIGA